MTLRPTPLGVHGAALAIPELDRGALHAARFLAGLGARDVTTEVDADALGESLGSLPAHPMEPATVIDDLARALEPGLVASGGGRYFGYVTGGALPVATAADWLVSAWDQNAAFYPMSPAVAVVEDVTGRWIADLLGLPATASFGFTTGTQSAHIVALAAARHAVLGRASWDVERDGLAGGPPVTVVASAARHVTIDRAVRVLGLGTESIRPVACDDQGSMHSEALRAALSTCDGPTIVCAQAGNVNTGSFDPIDAIADAVHGTDAWLHIDGAFGLWAAASPGYRHLVAGHARADSWSVDAHKWLNVPYDAAMVFVADADHHRSVTEVAAPYLPKDPSARHGSDWVLEFSRRARSVPAYAALRTLGRSGVAELIERCCELAAKFATGLAETPEIEVLNDVVLNQVLWRHRAGDNATRSVLDEIQSSGRTWMGPTTWQDTLAVRTSISGWATTTADIDEVLDLIDSIVVRCPAGRRPSERPEPEKGHS